MRRIPNQFGGENWDRPKTTLLIKGEKTDFIIGKSPNPFYFNRIVVAFSNIDSY